MSKRAFFFGCSLTSYTWHSWADILGLELAQRGYAVYNFGQSGFGNAAIAQCLMLADLKYKITDQDLIFILWSGWDREDFFKLTHWRAHGCILNHPAYSEDFFTNHWNLPNSLIKNMYYIYTVNKIYNITWQRQAISFENIEAVEKHFQKHLSDEIEQEREYISALDMIKNIIGIDNFDVTNNFFDETQEIDLFYQAQEKCGCIDGHPSPIQHMNFVEEYVCPYIDITLSNDVKQTIRAKDIEYADKFLNTPSDELDLYPIRMEHIDSIFEEIDTDAISSMNNFLENLEEFRLFLTNKISY